jgi:hypothetical protein
MGEAWPIEGMRRARWSGEAWLIVTGKAWPNEGLRRGPMEG